ncbi:Uncharacterized protein SCF082_LOCUS10289 [Durusdinium trenchii]|uniref:Uncharacterized protein n=1 Tax=Durusdinium trenchii TaxID=1381693 RepID=A0ABP0J5F0_9DINO
MSVRADRSVRGEFPGIDWHAFHSQNRRALHLPMSFMEATYAMDDLHRIEAILATVKPSSSSYQAARKSTDEVLADVKADPCGWRSLERNECFYHKSLGVRKLSCAVRLVRHSVALRRRERNGLDLGEKKEPHRVRRTSSGRRRTAARSEVGRGHVTVRGTFPVTAALPQVLGPVYGEST